MDFKTYRKQWDNAGKKTPKIPLNLDLELSAICNIRCPFCFLQNKNYTRPKYLFMPTTMAKCVLDDAANIGVPAVKFNWRGEATMHPDFSEITAYAADSKFHDILINTNGNYRSSKVYGLMNCTKVMYSVDSMEENTYKVMRAGGSLRIVLDNIEMLLKFGHRNVWVRRVLTDSNKAEDFKSSVAQKFGDAVKVAEHYVFDRAVVRKSNAPRTYCLYPSQRLVVGTSGDVFPCCVDYDEGMRVGNVYLKPISEIWDGFRMKFVRAMLKKGRMPSKQCANCTSWMAYKAPQRKMVADKAI